MVITMIKKFVSIISAVMILCGSVGNVFAYTFPTPDWGSVLAERTAMVEETDFELYTEGSIDSAPYFGVRLEPRGGAYIGMVAEYAEDFEPLGSYLTYIQGMKQPYIYNPANKIIRNGSAVATIGWTVTNSNVDYDMIRRVLEMLSKYNKPMFIRFANEMSEFQIGDDPELYKEIFRNVANMVHEYPNFATVWSPIDLGALDRPFQYYYPGDEYVDWVGVSCYSIKYFQGNQNTDYKSSVFFMTGDNAWATNRIKPLIKFMSDYNINKPVMISEGGVAVDNKYGESLEAWATPRLRNMLWSLVMKYPQIKLINYFNVPREEDEMFSITEHKYACDIFKEAENSGAYIRSAGGAPDFVYQRADDSAELAADSSGNIRLYTLAYFHNKPNITVNYSLDGEWYTSAAQIPYACNLNITQMSDGVHTIAISAEGSQKSYTFYKSGTVIRFGAEPESDDIRVVLNGKRLTFEQPPEITDGRTLVPMRAVFETLGAEVVWNDDTRIINAWRGSDGISMQIDNNQMYVNGTAITLDIPPRLINGYTMIPIRAVSEALSCTVTWDENTKTVYVTG